MPLPLLLIPPDRMVADAEDHCVKVALRDMPYGDSLVRQYRSRLRLLEDGKALGPAHARHDAIRARGMGRYSQWGQTLFFSASDHSDPRTNGRRYEVAWEALPPSPLNGEEQDRLDQITTAFRTGKSVDMDAVNRLMLLPHPDQRGQVFYALADALYVVGRNDAADELMVRAWTQGIRHRDVYAQALSWARRQRDDDRTRWLLQTAAPLAAEGGDLDWMIDIILRHHEWQGEQYTRTARSFHQDEFLINPLTRAFAPHRCCLPPHIKDGPLRVGYVLAGEASPDFSSLPEIVTDMALGHDPAMVTAQVFSLRPKAEVDGNPFFPPIRERLDQAGIPLTFLAPDSSFQGLKDDAATIAAQDLDVLLFSNATHWNLLMAALHPARLVAGLGLGECEMFTSTIFDRSFHFTPGPARDGRGVSHFVPAPAGNLPRSRLANPDQTQPRAAFDLPGDALILLSCARAIKFLEPRYWQVMDRVLGQSAQAHLVVVGLSAEEFAALPCGTEISAEHRSRIHLLGWRNDAPSIIGLAQIFIDTFPNGGGLSAFEAMHLGIPVVAGRESPLSLFDERVWSPVPDMVDNIAAPPLNDNDAIADAILALVRSPQLRADLGARGKISVQTLTDQQGSSANLARAYAQALAIGAHHF
jgi:hypothetical protein